MKCSPHTAGLLCVGLLLIPADAADVLFVDTDPTLSSTWSNLITGAGHTFTVFDSATYAISLNTQAAKDYVNSYDVIIISGSNPNFNSIRAYGAAWNAITTPMIISANYLLSGQFSSASWKWTTPGTGTTPNFTAAGDNSLDVLAPEDPIWSGISLTTGTAVTSPDLFDANAGALTLGANTLLPGITALATKTETPGTIAVGYAAPDALTTGSGARYFIAGFTGANGQAEPFTAEGEQVFLNAIAVLAGELVADTFQLRIAASSTTPGSFDFAWDSQSGKVYDLLSSTDLGTPISSWPVYDPDGEGGNDSYANLATAGDGVTTLTGVPGAGPRRFFAMVEKDAPPPPPLFVADFEADAGGFIVVDHSGGTGTVWAHGDPDSSGAGGTVSTGNAGSAKCWGTDISTPGFYATGTNTSLISPVIDLSAVPNAVLSFAQAIDILSGDTLVVNIIDADISGGISVLQAAAHTATPDTDTSNANWETVPSVAITGGRQVRIEWRFTGNNDGTYIGAYIDDVTVTAVP